MTDKLKIIWNEAIKIDRLEAPAFVWGGGGSGKDHVKAFRELHPSIVSKQMPVECKCQSVRPVAVTGSISCPCSITRASAALEE